MKQAQESTARYQNGAPLSIVDGVPVIVKGNLFTHLFCLFFVWEKRTDLLAPLSSTFFFVHT